MSTRRTLRLAEVGEQLGVHARTVGRWAAEGSLPSVRIGGLVLVRPEDLDRFLSNHLEGDEIARQRHASTRKPKSA